MIPTPIAITYLRKIHHGCRQQPTDIGTPRHRGQPGCGKNLLRCCATNGYESLAVSPFAARQEGAIAAPQDKSDKATPANKLLAEALCHDEAAHGPAPAAAEGAALARARAHPGSLEQKIIIRARALLGDRRMQNEIARLWRLLRGLCLLAIIIAAIAGAATARTVLAAAAANSPDGITVNFFWALASLLGLHFVAFLVWLLLVIVLPKATQGGMLGGALLWLWRQSASRLNAGRQRSAASAAILTIWGQGRTGRWLLSTLSHSIWTGYLVGTLFMTFALLSAQRFNFVWQTTILDADAYTALTATIAALPRALGLAMPDQAAVLAAQWPGPVAAGNETLWSTLLIAAILFYGLVPRLLAGAISFGLAYRAAVTTPLDVSQAGYARLVHLLAPQIADTQVIDGDGATLPAIAAIPDLHRPPPPPPPGPVYVLGWEIDAPAGGWPPLPIAPPLHDLGLCDGRDDLARAVATLGQNAQSPARLVVVIDLRHTPDRGVTAALLRLQEAAGHTVFMLFSGAAALAARLGAQDTHHRLADWVGACEQAGIQPTQMRAIDLDTPNPENRKYLALLFGQSP